MLNWRKCVAVAAVGAMLAVPARAETSYPYGLTGTETLEQAVVSVACAFDSVSITGGEEARAYSITPSEGTYYGLPIATIQVFDDEESGTNLMIGSSLLNTEKNLDKIKNAFVTLMGEYGKNYTSETSDSSMFYKWEHFSAMMLGVKSEDGPGTFMILLQWDW
jgi:hypothetical protein